MGGKPGGLELFSRFKVWELKGPKGDSSAGAGGQPHSDRSDSTAMNPERQNSENSVCVYVHR